MSYKYILDNQGNPVEEPDLMKWAQWFEKTDRHIAQTTIDGVKVSTVFLGMDHRFGCGGKPVLWETMIFGGPHDEYQVRSTSLDEAKKDHEAAVAIVKSSISH